MGQKRSSIEVASASSSFMQDVMQALLQQAERPTFKRARTVLRSAVKALDDDELKAELQAQLPAVLAELKVALASSAPATAPEAASPAPAEAAAAAAATHTPSRTARSSATGAAAPPSDRRRKRARTAALDMSTDTAYEAAVQACADADLQALWPARLPPHPALLTRAIAASEPPSAPDFERAARVCGCALAAAGCSDVSPVLAHVTQMVRQHVDAVSSSVLRSAAGASGAAPASLANLRVVDRAQEDLTELRATHDACSKCLRHLCALLPLHVAAAASGIPPQLLLRPQPAPSPAQVVWVLAAACASAHICTQLLEGAAGPLSLDRCRGVVSCTAARVEGIAIIQTSDSNGVPAGTALLLELAPSTVELHAAAAVPALAWLALHDVLATRNGHGPVTLEQVLLHRRCAYVYARIVGDKRGAARARRAFDGRPCAAELASWVQAHSGHPAIARCVAAARKLGGGGPESLLRALMSDSMTIEDVTAMYELWKSDEAAGSAGDPEAAHGMHARAEVDTTATAVQDEDLFMLDGVGRASAFDGGWEGDERSESDSGSDEDVDVLRLSRTGTSKSDGSQRTDDSDSDGGSDGS